MSVKNYDLIISGLGCAGLSLAVRLSKAGLTVGKRILLIDREHKNSNNRTWCFWEMGPGFFEEIVHKTWDHAWFHSNDFSKLLELEPYVYKMIRGLDFYQHCMKIINDDQAFEIIYDEVLSVQSTEGVGVCKTATETYHAPQVFNSILFDKPVLCRGEFFLKQHFKGWFIKTKEDVFDPRTATLMDFRPDQQHGTTFIYVMPFSANSALVEYTLFTEDTLTQKEYDQGLDLYLRAQLGLDEWEIIEEEFGIIPMTNHRFQRQNGCIVNIGTAGGMTKASSGYTFRFIQKDTERIVQQMSKQSKPNYQHRDHSRFLWYDSIFLNILQLKKLHGADIFTDLFSQNDAGKILKFLDNETSFQEEVKILWSMPQWPFMKAGVQEGLKAIKTIK
jgi:lycopene beta-cyclase